MLLKFNSHPRPGFYDDTGKFVTAETQSSVGSTHVHTVTANTGGGGAGVSSGGGGGGMSGFGSGQDMGMGGGPQGAQDRYNSVRDRLDEGSVLEDWIPRDAAGLDRMFRLMYHRDHIAGTIVDIIADLIWSEFELGGVKDPQIKKIYMDTMDAIDPVGVMPDVTREFLVLGRSVSSLIFDEKKGIPRDMVSHDPDFIRLTPIPVKGFDPKIDLIPSPALLQFIESVDPRDADARKILPAAYIDAIKKSGGGAGRNSGMTMMPAAGNMAATGGGIPLDPINTLFMARRVFNYDSIGTSFFTRLISFWALEKALINATLTSARRRSRSILHIKAGLDNQWEPTNQELDSIAGLFIAADDDPVGAVVATRTGVDASEIRDGANFYKWSDEWALLTEGKLRALGTNDALLTGESTYSNQEAARTMFMEKAKALRESLTKRMYYKRIFPLIARLHEFRKTTTASIDHGIIIKPANQSKNSYSYTGNEDALKNKLTQREALSIPDSELIMPTISWNKELVYSVDEKKLEIYEKMEDKGVPISIRNWASAGSVDLDAQLSDIENDTLLRRRINEWKAKAEVNPEAEAKLEFLNNLRGVATSQLREVVGSTEHLGPIAGYPFWGEKGTIGSLKGIDLNGFLSKINAADNSSLALGDYYALTNRLMAHFKEPKSAQAAHYLMYRTGLTGVKPSLDSNTIAMLAESVKKSLDKYASHASVYELGMAAKSELDTIASLSTTHKEKALDSVYNTAGRMNKPIASKVKGLNIDPTSSTSKNLFAGKDT
jgi:hypothetical protein